MPALNVWMNGDLVGTWSTRRGGTPTFRYERSWVESPQARALSLSLPMTPDREVLGPVVDHYFDNLLPDNLDIRRRLSTRFGLDSIEPFDLLEAIGRDCVGAVQLLPQDQSPVGWNRVQATALSELDVERALRAVTQPPPLRHRSNEADDEFRISITGAQEKTALLSMGDQWYRPHHATPTTHILKLPLGIVGNFRSDFSHSVENEWFCARLLQAFGLPVAETQMANFGEQKVLVVTRFDRRWFGVDAQGAATRGFTPPPEAWIARLPQEDFCQATGRSPLQRYEAEGGPSMNEILRTLAGSEHADIDCADFALAQLAFWLLAATDGHGKNFSMHHRAGGFYSLTPLYDVLSAWPMIGSGPNQLPLQDAKLALAVTGRNRHYKLVEIQARHWQALALRVGGAPLWQRMRTLVESVDEALERVCGQVSPGFPAVVMDTISAGVRRQAVTFLRAAPVA